MSTLCTGRSSPPAGYWGWSNWKVDTGAATYQSYHFSENQVLGLQGGKNSLNYWVLVFEATSGAHVSLNRWVTAHPGGANVLLADSSVEFWPINISEEVTDIFKDENTAWSLALAYWNVYFPQYRDRFRGPGRWNY
jgi:prepilin-type processing-associated H-X9-DG protein